MAVRKKWKRGERVEGLSLSLFLGARPAARSLSSGPLSVPGGGETAAGAPQAARPRERTAREKHHTLSLSSNARLFFLSIFLTHLGRLGREVVRELHGQRVVPALPVGAFRARDDALPEELVGGAEDEREEGSEKRGREGRFRNPLGRLEKGASLKVAAAGGHARGAAALGSAGPSLSLSLSPARAETAPRTGPQSESEVQAPLSFNPHLLFFLSPVRLGRGLGDKAEGSVLAEGFPLLGQAGEGEGGHEGIGKTEAPCEWMEGRLRK